MLERILTISGKPGLYSLVSRGNKSLIVESLDEKKKRMPVYPNELVVSLYNIAMFTDEDDVPLCDILETLKEKQNGALIEMDVKKASKDDLFNFFAEVLPNFDRDRVYPNDIKKLINWYNILITNGIDTFKTEENQESAE